MLAQLFAYTDTLFQPQIQKAINSGPYSALICPNANSRHFHQDQWSLSFAPHMGRQNSFFTEAIHSASELLCLRCTWPGGFRSAAHTASSAHCSPTVSLAGLSFKWTLFHRQTRAGYLFPLIHWIYKKHASWVTLNKRQNCFYSVFTHNKMSQSSKQTVHNMPDY